jgi:pSer/pThr/pTyr-binding forkhead associated (FHA) protein
MPSDVYDGAQINGQNFPREKITTLGSTDASDIQLGDRNNGVSSKHAYVYTDPQGKTWVADANSTYGTFVVDGSGNRVPLPKPNADGSLNWHELKVGDQIGLGPRFTAQVKDPAMTVKDSGGRIGGKPFVRETVRTVGSTDVSDLQLGSKNEGVSRKHAYFYTDAGGQMWVADAGSRNGTYIIDDAGHKIPLQHPGANGQPNWVALKPGQKISLGGSYTVDLTPPPRINPTRTLSPRDYTRGATLSGTVQDTLVSLFGSN